MKVSYNSETKQYTFEDGVYTASITNSSIKCYKQDDFSYINTDIEWSQITKDRCETLKNKICEWISDEDTIGDKKLNTIVKMIDCIIIHKNKVNNTSTYEKTFCTFPDGIQVEVIRENDVITQVVMHDCYMKFMRNGEIDTTNPHAFVNIISHYGDGGIIEALNRIDDSLRRLNLDNPKDFDVAIFIRECIFTYKARLNAYDPEYVKSRRDFPIVYMNNDAEWVDILFRNFRGYKFLSFVGIVTHQCYDILMKNDEVSKVMIKQIRKEKSIADNINIIIRVKPDQDAQDRTARLIYVSGNDPMTCPAGSGFNYCFTGNKANIVNVVNNTIKSFNKYNKHHSPIENLVADGKILVINMKLPKALKGVYRSENHWDVAIMRDECKYSFGDNAISAYKAEAIYFKLATDQYFVFKSCIRKENTICTKVDVLADIEKLKTCSHLIKDVYE